MQTNLNGSTIANMTGTADDDTYTNNGTVSDSVDMSQGGVDTFTNTGTVSHSVYLPAQDGSTFTNSGTIGNDLNFRIYGSYNTGNGVESGYNSLTNSGTLKTWLLYGSYNSGDGSSGGNNTISNSGTVSYSLVGSGNVGENSSGGNNTITNSNYVAQYIQGSYNGHFYSSGGGNKITNSGTVGLDVIGSNNRMDHSSGGENILVNNGTANLNLIGSQNYERHASGGNNTITNSGSVQQNIIGTMNGAPSGSTSGGGNSGGGNKITNSGTVLRSIYGTWNYNDDSSGGENTITNSGTVNWSIYGTCTNSSVDDSQGGNNTIYNYSIVIGDIYGSKNADGSPLATFSGGGNTIYNSGTVTNIYGSSHGWYFSGNGNAIYNSGTVTGSIYGTYNGGTHSSGTGNTIVNQAGGTVAGNIYGTRNRGDNCTSAGNTIYNSGAVTGSIYGNVSTGEGNSGGGNTIINQAGGTVAGSIYGTSNQGDNCTSTGNTIINHGTVTGDIYGTQNTGAGSSGGDDSITNSGTVGGGIYAGDGNDTVVIQGNSSVAGNVDGQGGTDTLRFENAGTRSLDQYINFENLALVGSGETTLAGNWTISGNLTLNGGTANITGTANISGDTTVNGSTLNVSGTLDTGGLVIYSGGHCDISGTVNTGNTYLAGTMQMNGTLNSTATTITVSGALWGTGTINGRLTVNGGLAPGNSIGTLTVNGDVTFNNSSAYIAEVDTEGACDVLSVTGKVTINGGTIFTSLPQSLYTNGQSWQVITATDGISGNFSNLSGQPDSVTLYLATVNRGTSLDLEVRRISFAEFGSTANEKAVGSGLDLVVPLAQASGGEMAALIQTVDWSYGASDIQIMLSQINPEMYDGFSWAAKNNSQIFSEVLKQRASLLRLIRALSAPGSAANQGLVELAAAEVPGSGLVPPGPSPRGWNLWARFLGGQSGQRAADERLGYSTANGGAVFGGDGRALPWLTVGFSLGASQSDLDFSGSGYDGEQQGLHVGLYALAENGPLYLHGSLAFSKYQNTATRPIEFGAVDTDAKAGFDSQALLAKMAAGYDFKAGGWLLGPVASVSYLDLQEEPFSESGAGFLNLAVRERNNGYLASSLGFRVARLFKTGDGHLLPRLSVGWRHGFDNSARSVTANFEGHEAASFTVQGIAPALDLLSIQAGASFFVREDIAAYLDYALTMGDGLASHVFSAGMAWRF